LASADHGQSAPTLYTAQEAAEILRVKKSWLERQAAARKVPFTLLGGAYRFTLAHLVAIVQMHEQAPSGQADRNRGTRARKTRAPQRAVDGSPALLRPRPRSGPHRIA
jgi:excisionase family DNA binding protein